MAEKDDKPESADWKRHKSGLYLPKGTSEGGKKPTVGFARALESK